jgi:hypothetical protein
MNQDFINALSQATGKEETTIREMVKRINSVMLFDLNEEEIAQRVLLHFNIASSSIITLYGVKICTNDCILGFDFFSNFKVFKKL